MHGELEEIYEFVKTVRPFDELEDQELRKLCKQLMIRYFKRQQQILKTGQSTDSLYIVRTGAADIFSADGSFLIRVNEKGCFGFVSVINQKPSSSDVIAHEDCLVYIMSGDLFRSICENHADFKDHFVMAESQRLRKALGRLRGKNFQFSARLAAPVASIVSREPVMCRENLSIHRAAEKMATGNVSTLMIVDENENLIGLITDRDIRNRVVAKNLDISNPVKSVMSDELITINADRMAFEAGLLMMQHNVHHLPIVSQSKPMGLISTTDLLKLSNQSPIYTISEISKATKLSQLVNISKSIPDILKQLVNSGLPAHQVGKMISTLGENINIRLLQLAEQKFGKAPIDCCWLAAGSLGRHEQLLHSDQDNVLLLSDDYDKSSHDEYFLSLTQYVSDGLNECGYVYCPGDVMATNPKWRQPLHEWKNYFNTWINVPESKALMYCSIFFDMRAIHGKTELFDELKLHYLELVKDNHLFLSHLAVNALQNTPPLGFFRQFVLVDDKEHKNQLNLKKRGTAPIVDLARVYVLAEGLNSINTHNRILDAKTHGIISDEAADNLLDAYEFINHFRMQHQANQISNKIEADNYANPNELSSFERDHLRDAFKIVEQMQKYLAQRYTTSHMR